MARRVSRYECESQSRFFSRRGPGRGCLAGGRGRLPGDRNAYGKRKGTIDNGFEKEMARSRKSPV